MAHRNTTELTVAMISEHGDPLAPLGGQQAGGQNVYVYELARALSRLGVRVDVFTRWENRKAAQKVRFATRAKVIRLKAGPRHFISKDQFGPLMPEFVERFLEYGRETKTKYDLIHSNYYYSGWAGIRLKQILEIPLVATFHSLGKMKQTALGKSDTSPTERLDIEQQIFAEADRIIATSPQEKAFMAKAYGADERNIAIVPPGVNVRRFSPVKQDAARKRLKLDPEKHIVVFAGKMEPRKGALTLVEAVDRIRTDASDVFDALEVFLFSGDPRQRLRKEARETDFRHMIRDEIAQRKLGHTIKFLPGVGQEMLHYYYAAADVVAMPSYYEPFGMVAIEAMATGTPVVASAVGGLLWTVQDGVTGFQVKPRNAGDLAKKLLRVLRDPTLRASLGEQAHERTTADFAWQSVAATIYNEYRRLT